MNTLSPKCPSASIDNSVRLLQLADVARYSQKRDEVKQADLSFQMHFSVLCSWIRNSFSDQIYRISLEFFFITYGQLFVGLFAEREEGAKGCLFLDKIAAAERLINPLCA